MDKSEWTSLNGLVRMSYVVKMNKYPSKQAEMISLNGRVEKEESKWIVWMNKWKWTSRNVPMNN